MPPKFIRLEETHSGNADKNGRHRTNTNDEHQSLNKPMYHSIILQNKDLFLLFVCTRASEARNNDYQKKFDQEIAKMWKNQRQQPAHERLTSTMLEIIEQRQNNVIECIKAIYRLKGDFYARVPPRTLLIMH